MSGVARRQRPPRAPHECRCAVPSDHKRRQKYLYGPGVEERLRAIVLAHSEDSPELSEHSADGRRLIREVREIVELMGPET